MENADEPQQNRLLLKFSYKKDQWSPLNPEGKKQYDRDFLLQLQSVPSSLRKLSNLPISSIIKDKVYIHKLPEVSIKPGPEPPPKKANKKAQQARKLSSTSNPKPRKSLEEIKEHLSSLLEKDAKLEEIFNWIDGNVPETRDPAFIRALVTAVHKNSCIASGTSWKVDISKLKLRTPLISRYVSADEKLQLHALYATQALSNQLNHPSGLLHQMFDVLYDEGVVSDEALVEWEKSDDPYEAVD